MLPKLNFRKSLAAFILPSLALIIGAGLVQANQIKSIGADKAKEIALADAKAKEKDVYHLKVESETDDGRAVYDVEFYVASEEREYDYTIDRRTGSILDVDDDMESYKAPARKTNKPKATTSNQTPAQPAQPTKPAQPTQPTKPAQPAQPTQPTKPAQPTQPAQPAPATPAPRTDDDWDDDDDDWDDDDDDYGYGHVYYGDDDWDDDYGDDDWDD